LSGAIRRRLALDRIRLPVGVTLFGTLVGILVPGLAVYLKGSRLWGGAAMGACALAASVFFLWLGHPVATWAFALLMSVHATGLLYYLGPLLADSSFQFRVFCAVGVLALLGFVLYLPVGNFLENHWFMPMAVRGQVVVVDKTKSARELNRGDWVAYTVGGGRGRGVYLIEGYAVGRVLAVGGDQVRFTAESVEINGASLPRLPRMPTDGEIVVPEGALFVWPELDITIRGQVPEGNVTGALLELAVVPASQVVGKPFERWFWRRQLSS